jgi:Zn-dependent metalloprotease
MKLHRAILGFIIFAAIWFAPIDGASSSRSATGEFLSNEGGDWKFHWSPNGNVRALYGLGKERILPDIESAKRLLSDYAEMFGIEDLSHLLPIEIDRDESGASFLFEQVVSGIRVVGGEWSVHTNKHGQLIATGGQYFTMKGLAAGPVRPSEECHSTVERFRFSDGGVSDGTLMILGAIGNARLVWKFSTFSKRIPGQWAVYVDALVPQKILRVHREFVEETATGKVFHENPTVSPGLAAEQFRYLKDAGELTGKYTRTYNANFQLTPPGRIDVSQYTTAAEADEDYTYPTTDSRFSEAMAYFHINVVHDRWRSFGFRKLNRQLPVFVNVATSTGEGFDNAFYTRGRSGPLRNGAIVMGGGNFFQNFGHDADVYYHEYGHAVLDRAKPGFFEAVENNYPWAFHEGFSDISSAAITGNSKLAEFALSSRETGKFFGRNIENKNSFPQDVILKGYGKSESHHTGLIIGGAWWDLQKTTGIDTAQKILYRSLVFLPNNMTFFDLRDAMLTADLRTHGGVNEAAITGAFAKHGISGSDPGQKGTVQIRSLRTASLDFSTFRITLKTNFKRGEYIVVLAGYRGSGLTPGYNLIPIELQVSGPPNANVDAFPIQDEVVNGRRMRKKGAWLAEIGTSDATALGEYTVLLRARLGGTTVVTEPQSVKFNVIP